MSQEPPPPPADAGPPRQRLSLGTGKAKGKAFGKKGKNKPINKPAVSAGITVTGVVYRKGNIGQCQMY